LEKCKSGKMNISPFQKKDYSNQLRILNNRIDMLKQIYYYKCIKKIKKSMSMKIDKTLIGKIPLRLNLNIKNNNSNKDNSTSPISFKADSNGNNTLKAYSNEDKTKLKLYLTPPGSQ